jgi:hypothetical protein
MIAAPARRFALDPDDRMATAHHESGHAVVARALGLEVTRVTLAPYWQRAGRLGVCCTRYSDDPNGCWAQAVTDLAGPVAEQKFARYPLATVAMLERSAWKTDFKNASESLRELGGAVTMKQAGNMAAHLVGEHWGAIVRVAAALAADGELSGTSLERLRSAKQRNFSRPYVGERECG